MQERAESYVDLNEGEKSSLRQKVAEARSLTRDFSPASLGKSVVGEAPSLIAFYLPQFHPVEINDKTWGVGFTEWTNVRKAKPNYVGHRQPRVPSLLGYYDLRDPTVMDKQVELAKKFGIDGFCYYYYYFSGKRVLDMPLERLLETGKPSMPFCLAWANENWTKTWEGDKETVLLEHVYSDLQNNAVMNDLIRYFKHPLYIRIDNKPLFVVYRAGQLPDVTNLVSMWRKMCREAGVGEIYLAMVEAAELAWAGVDPSKFGFDAAIEFPPHNPGPSVPPPDHLLNPNFSGLFLDFNSVVQRYASAPIPPYTRFRGVIAGWDNTARRQDKPAIFLNATPSAYQVWLESALEDVQIVNPSHERMVFINAWNEWGEGTYLEPDADFGYGYLEATAAAISNHKERFSIGNSHSEIEKVANSDNTGSAVNRPVCLNRVKTSFTHRGVSYLRFFEDLNLALLPRNYFEIGENIDNSVDKWTCAAVCVDPNLRSFHDETGPGKYRSFYAMSPDQFFEQGGAKRHFPHGIDLAFLDGLHLSEHLLRDFINTERCCHRRSVILLHDCLPLNSRMAEREYRVGHPSEGPLWGGWTGDVWRVLFALKKFRPDLSIKYFDCEPTGLVAVSKLDPNSHILEDNFQKIVSYMMSLRYDYRMSIELWGLFPTISSQEYLGKLELLKGVIELTA